MSTININIQLDSSEPMFSNIIAALSGVSTTAKAVAKMEVTDAEEVKAPAPAKTTAPRPSRAKAKPAPIEDEDEDEDEEFETGQEGEGMEDEEEITADDLRALQATKIDKHRAALKAQYTKLGATGIKDLAPENFQKMFDFLSKLK